MCVEQLRRRVRDERRAERLCVMHCGGWRGLSERGVQHRCILSNYRGQHPQLATHAASRAADESKCRDGFGGESVE